ncbi:MAG: hypothetical protein KDE27_09190 [Planctomycetes bacterium]|nr:hypothetical protein [Planctomycetota bacterium]
MEDVLSNALMLGLGRDSDRVRSFLTKARLECATGPELLLATAAEFDIDQAELKGEVERYRHVNCKHGRAGMRADDPTQPPIGGLDEVTEVSEFAKNVTLHVVLHELGHALIREFDLPVLGNEETAADAFATHYLVTHLPDRALDALRARVDSLLFEADEVPRDQWTVRGEHNNDARRAYQIAALAVAADPVKYAVVGRAARMSAEEMRRAADYGTEIHRSWRRILQPLRMPAGVLSDEARIRVDDGGSFVSQVRSTPLLSDLEAAVRSFDWHSQVTIAFVQGEGGAAWSRRLRTVTVHGGYLRRFVRQGEAIARAR